MIITIAIDGPVGAGKSTIAQEVAKRLHIPHLDTGAMYRALGYDSMKKGIDLNNELEVNHYLDKVDVTVQLTQGKQEVLVNGENVTSNIRSPEVSMAASNISKWRKVRDKMVSLQQSIAKSQSIVLDGRDIGTRVLPKADVKIFLTASAQVRAQRRFDELIKKGEKVSYEEVLKDLQARDLQDATRKVDPLKAAEDAYQLDTSNLTISQVVEEILRIAEGKNGRKK